ncbi:uncharacterized protein LOC142342213 isoform X3 [Convolutriloba macropyga]|uniref:uncharacterized protein LOC142342213 isoform X3 n=1 Tax=Convolutriloba macropyga TaxID=536237 RepID=UPI003F526BE6
MRGFFAIMALGVITAFILFSTVSAQPSPTTVVLASHDKTTATLTIDTSDANFSAVQFDLVAYNCTDGTNQITGAECAITLPNSGALSPAPYSVSWSGLIPGKQYGFEIDTLDFENGSTSGNITSGINLTPFCTTANPPGNLTAVEGSGVDVVDYTVVNNTVGVTEGYVVQIAMWDGSMFVMVSEDNNTAGSYAQMGSFSSLTKGELYKLTAFADDECPEYELSTENVTAYFQSGLDVPTMDLTLLKKDSTQMCFIWQYSGSGSWNMVKVYLMQSGVNKGTYSKSASSGPCTICVTQSGADTSMEADVFFTAGNEVTANGMTFTKYSDSRNSSYNFTDFSVLTNHSSDCDMDVVNCTVNLIVDYSINSHANNIYVNLNGNLSAWEPPRS